MKNETEKKERIETHVSVAVLASTDIENPKNLLCVRQKGSELWGVPAGKLEYRETPKMAVMREFEEETGLLAENIRFLFPSVPVGLTTVLGDDQVSLGLIFRAQFEPDSLSFYTGQSIYPESEEIEEVTLMGFEEIVELCRESGRCLHRPEYSLPTFYYWLGLCLENCSEEEFEGKMRTIERAGLDLDLITSIEGEGVVIERFKYRQLRLL